MKEVQRTRTLTVTRLKAQLSEAVGEAQHTCGEIIIEKHGHRGARVFADEPEFFATKHFKRVEDRLETLRG